MHYKRLIAGVNAYYWERKMNRESFPESPYQEGGAEPDYFDALNEKKPISERVRIIVNKWGKCGAHIVDAKLRTALKNFQKKRKLVLQWNMARFTQSSLWDNHHEIVGLFDSFVESLKRRGYSYTGASKALHILNPAFFVMWDDAIRYEYGCSEINEGYFNFLLRSQKEIKEVFETYIKDYGNAHDPSKEIPQRIYSEYNGHSKTIVKLLDEYNWAKYKNGWI